ncbi:hypothetical protein [Dyella kyungheensis]|uniref:DUF1232 domain-containing protein n=1 Tax=Dyella kyungheensis TaxID=1242174 RepID=A0ABS2JPF2_9GAMM|nr:hypothetical protein [Dyella kyungheensis]MBM7120885.1 hypothetical protein [Dyella kyungheensis]
MAWLDPQWFTLEALTAEWRRKDVRKWMIGVITVTVVLILLSQPETVPTALTIDSVGIDVFLALLEMQIMVAVLLYREQLMGWLRTAYVADNALGTLMRKLVSLGRNMREATRGSFRE